MMTNHQGAMFRRIHSGFEANLTLGTRIGTPAIAILPFLQVGEPGAVKGVPGSGGSECPIMDGHGLRTCPGLLYVMMPKGRPSPPPGCCPGLWPGMMVRELFDSLPPGFQAEPQVQLGSGGEVDIGTVEENATDLFVGTARIRDAGISDPDFGTGDGDFGTG